MLTLPGEPGLPVSIEQVFHTWVEKAMAKNIEDLQSYLLKLDVTYQEPEPGTFVIKSTDGSNIVVRVADSVVVFRSKVMPVPEKNKEAFFRMLLELNGSEMLHGHYGLEGDAVVLCDALQLENLDFNEFAATFDEISLVLATHHKQLAPFYKG